MGIFGRAAETHHRLVLEGQLDVAFAEGTARYLDECPALSPAEARFFALRDAGYHGGIDQDGFPVDVDTWINERMGR